MFAKYLHVLLLIALLFTFASGQVKDSKKFSRLRVSVDLRERLAERFNLFVEYERTGQYEKQYDLLADKHLEFLRRQNVGRENYAEFKRRLEDSSGKLVELKVTDVYRKLKDGRWVGISVRAKLRKDSKMYSEEPVMIAYLQGGDWFFSFTYIEV